MSGPAYLDYNATTPVAAEVVEAMLPYLTEHFGNPSSSHSHGKKTARAVRAARESVANLLHERLAATVPGPMLNAHPSERLPNTLHVSFPGIAGHELLSREKTSVPATTELRQSSSWRFYRLCEVSRSRTCLETLNAIPSALWRTRIPHRRCLPPKRGDPLASRRSGGRSSRG